MKVADIRCFCPKTFRKEGTRKVQITQIKERNKETFPKVLWERFMKMLVEGFGEDVLKQCVYTSIKG